MLPCVVLLNNVCLLFHTQCIMALSHSFLLLSLLCKHTSYNTVLKHQLLFYYYVPEFCCISFSQVQGCYTYCFFFVCVCNCFITSYKQHMHNNNNIKYWIRVCWSDEGCGKAKRLIWIRFEWPVPTVYDRHLQRPFSWDLTSSLN